MAITVMVAVLSCACTGSASVRVPGTRVATRSSVARRPASSPATGPVGVVVAAAPWRLTRPLSRAVGLAVRGWLLVVGGLLGDGGSTGAVVAVDPRTGRVRSWGVLALAAHDAAGAVLGGAPVLFGGGVDASSAAVQRLRPGSTATRIGSLPTARSDLSAVRVGREAYLLGGYDGSRWQPVVLGTVDGRHFVSVASLPVPVRYAATAVLGDSIWLFGGQSVAGPTDAVQRIDLSRGTATLAGRLPQPRTEATALVLDGTIFVCGGRVAGGFSDQVLRFGPGPREFTQAGRLPAPVADAAGVVLDGVGYLLGGENPRPTTTVSTLRAAPPR